MIRKRLEHIMRRNLFRFAAELVPLELRFEEKDHAKFRCLSREVLRREPWYPEQIVRCAIVPHVIEAMDPLGVDTDVCDDPVAEEEEA